MYKTVKKKDFGRVFFCQQIELYSVLQKYSVKYLTDIIRAGVKTNSHVVHAVKTFTKKRRGLGEVLLQRAYPYHREMK